MTEAHGTLACALAPGRAPALAAAITTGGGRVVGPTGAEALVWTDPTDVDGLRALLADAPAIRWVQLPFAGVDTFASVLGDGRTWTSAKGAYAEPVAEHALALGLAGLRGLPARARASSWGTAAGRRLAGHARRHRRRGQHHPGVAGPAGTLRGRGHGGAPPRRPLDGAHHVVGPDRLHDVLPGAALVVLTLALTPQTTRIIDADALERVDGDAWLVNVARGAHVATDALVAALQEGAIGGAALDVTDPEPLPDDHPLWRLDNCLITPHVANTWEMAEPLLAERIRANVERFRQGEPLLGLVDPALGY